MTFALSALVVEDNAHMRLLLSAILRDLGIAKVAAVDSVEAARRKLGSKPFDVVLIDVGLGEESGLDFIHEVRLDRRSKHRHTPMLVISGQGQRPTIEAARDAGADGFLIKPVSTGAVADKVKRLLHEPQPYVESETYFGPDRRRRRDPSYRGPERRGGGAAFEVD